jgi:hypothetical protein
LTKIPATFAQSLSCGKLPLVLNIQKHRQGKSDQTTKLVFYSTSDHGWNPPKAKNTGDVCPESGIKWPSDTIIES